MWSQRSVVENPSCEHVIAKTAVAIERAIVQGIFLRRMSLVKLRAHCARKFVLAGKEQEPGRLGTTKSCHVDGRWRGCTAPGVL